MATNGRPQEWCRAARARTQAAQRLTSAAARRASVIRGAPRKRADFLAAATGAKVPTAGSSIAGAGERESGPVRIGFTSIAEGRKRRRAQPGTPSPQGSRELSAATGLSSGHDYVLIGRRAALSLPFDQITEDFNARCGVRVPK